MPETVSVIVSGKVQGVFYRQATTEKARQLGVSGLVSNHPDGTVHILATGSREQLDELVSWCKEGPIQARVSSVDVERLPERQFTGFRIVR